MANRLLLQTLLRFSDDIKSGAAKVQDVVTDYFNQTGKSVTDEERGIILKEFQDNAPSNVEEGDFSSDFLFTDKAKSKTPLTNETTEVYKIGDDLEVDSVGKVGNFDMDTFRAGLEQSYRETVAKTLKELQEASPAEKSKMIKEIINRKGLYRSFDQVDISKLLKSVDDSQLQDFVKVQAQKPTTLRPKRYLGYTEDGRPIESPVYFDDMGANEKSIDFGNYKNKKDRSEYAEFVRKMRNEGIRNKDIQNIARTTGDIAEGKRAATTLARANDMSADTKIKQEFLSELDEKVMDKGPRYFQEEFQGYDSYGELIQSETSRIRNGIVDDLEELGVDEEKVLRIMSYANDVAKKNPYQPEAFIEAIKQDIELEGIKYDMSFWENYISKILELSTKAEPRFAGGGLV